MSEIVGQLLNCTRCNHSVGSHEGGGCRIRDCGCTLTLDAAVQENVALDIKHYQNSFTS